MERNASEDAGAQVTRCDDDENACVHAALAIHFTLSQLPCKQENRSY